MLQLKLHMIKYILFILYFNVCSDINITIYNLKNFKINPIKLEKLSKL